MPSDMDLKGIQSSSFFSEEILSPNERQIGFWKTQAMHDLNGLKREGAVGMSVESKMKSYELAGSYASGRQRTNLGFGKHAVGAERAARHSMQRPVDCGPGTITHPTTEPPYTTKGDGAHAASAQYANGFFSSSFSETFNKLKLSSNNGLCGRSFGASQYAEEEPCESLEEIEAQTIGNLLPNDDELLSGVTDGFNYAARPVTGDNEDFDLFSSGGGLDLGDDGLPPRQRFRRNSDQLGESVSSASEEQPSRTLFVCNIDGNIEDSELQILFEQFGDIHTLHTTCKHRGFVMVSYYDIRAAQNAIRSVQNKPLRHQKLDIHFSIPKESSSEKDINQGTLVIYNLESSVSHEELRQIFGVYGEIKGVQEIPHNNHQKFIEFYDIRAAEAALRALDMSVIAGKQIKLEPSRPGGAKRLTRLFPPESQQHDHSSTYLQISHSPVNPSQVFSVSHGGISSFGMDNRTASGAQSVVQATVNPFVENVLQYGMSNSVPIGSPSLMKIQSVANQSRLPESGYSQAQPKIDFQTNLYPHSLPEYHDGLTNGSPCNCQSMAVNNNARPSERIESRQFCRVGSSESVFSSSATGSFPSPGRNYMWSNPHHAQPQGMMWPNSPTFVNGLCTVQAPSQLHTIPRPPSHMVNTVLPLNSHVGSAPSVNRSLWDRRRSYAAEAPDISSIPAGSLGNMRNSSNSPHHLEFLSQNLFPQVGGGNCIDLTMPPKNAGLHSPHHGCLMFPGSPMIPMMTPLESPKERASRSHRNDAGSNQADNKKQFELDLDRIVRGEDKRTTLMIKNIPNKYTSKMLLSAIDERHRGSYDFIYLPIDFKNKCNVGYAFINMIDPSFIIPFYQAFNGKRWEKFNSEKVASLAYARIQGKAALIAHFQNSSLMNEDKRCRPILFNTEGPNAGDQVPFPMGVNVRHRPSKTRATSSEEIPQESKPDVLIDEKSSYGDTSSRSSKDSD